MPRLALFLIASLIVMVAAAPAGATYPGKNGRLAVSAYTDDGWALHTMQPDGSGLTRLSAPGRQVFDPSWSADGARIVYQVNGEAGPDLFAADADGSDEVRLTSDGKSLHPALSPDGKRLAFMHEELSSYVVQTMNLDGSDRRTIGAGSPFDAPSWSPDGSKLVFAREGRGAPDANGFTPQTWRLVIADVTTGAQHVITPESVQAHGPSFAPDGRRVVYSGDNRLHVIGANGRGDVELPAEQTFWDSGPVFSPDSTRIAYGSGPDVRVVDLDGSNPTVVRVGDSSPSAYVDWQPLDPPPFVPPVDPPATPAPACSQVQSGTSRGNWLTGTGGGDLIRGLAGNDRLSGGGGADCLYGGAGNDLLSGGAGNDRLDGFRGNDVLKGGPGRDRFAGGTGSDRVNARDGVSEKIDCGPNRDTAMIDPSDVVRRCERVIR